MGRQVGEQPLAKQLGIGEIQGTEIVKRERVIKQMAFKCKD